MLVSILWTCVFKIKTEEEKMEKIKLGILGMGTVASGLINIIETNNSKIIKTTTTCAVYFITL